MVNVGDMYIRFYNDVDEAIKYYTMAVDKDNSQAMIMLGKIHTGEISTLMYPRGLSGCDKNNYDKYYDEEKAKTLFNKAIEIAKKKADETPLNKLHLANIYGQIDPNDPIKMETYESIIDTGVLSDNDNASMKT